MVNYPYPKPLWYTVTLLLEKLFHEWSAAQEAWIDVNDLHEFHCYINLGTTKSIQISIHYFQQDNLLEYFWCSFEYISFSRSDLSHQLTFDLEYLRNLEYWDDYAFLKLNHAYIRKPKMSVSLTAWVSTHCLLLHIDYRVDTRSIFIHRDSHCIWHDGNDATALRMG